MSHNARTQADAVWLSVPPYGPLAYDYQSLDGKLTGAIDGDFGGTWSTSSVWTIGGAGLQVTGPIVVQGQGSLIETAGGASSITLGDTNDYPEYVPGHPGMARPLPVSAIDATWAPAYAWGQYRATIGAAEVVGIQSVALALKNPDLTITVPEFFLPLRVHDGGTLGSVTLTFRVPNLRSAPPQIMPKIRVVRRDATGALTVMRGATTDAAGFIADVNGFVSIGDPNTGGPVKPPSAAAWYFGGNAQTITYVCDQNNVIDISQYSYFLHVVEESLGPTTLSAPFPLAINVLTPVRGCVLGIGSIGDAIDNGGALGMDGFTTATGDRILAPQRSDQRTIPVTTNTALATVYIANSAANSPWKPPADFHDATNMYQGTLIPVLQGAEFGNTAWQFLNPNGTLTATPAAPLTETTSRIFVCPPKLAGNIYHSAVANMAIADTRYQ